MSGTLNGRSCVSSHLKKSEPNIKHIIHEQEQSLFQMTDFRTAWDEDYRSRGQLWGASPAALPGIPAGSRVLEIGCGSGKTAGALVHRSCDITAIDFSATAVAMTRRVMIRYHAGDAVVADARNLPFRHTTFGCVIARHVIGHMHKDDRMAAAREAARVLQPGGRVFLQVFSVDDLRNGVGKKVEDTTYLRGTGIITHYFTGPEVEALFPTLEKESVTNRRWTMRIRGRDLLRAEIVAIFMKG
jgi:ubiquinone/menaquinone biosynthesis C-methylase UbiE